MTGACQGDFICNEPFKMSKGEFARKMFQLWGVIPAALLSIVFILGVAAGLVLDIRYIIVSAMAVFILFPMVILFLYYYHGLNRDSYFNIVSHNLTFCDSGVKITMFFTSESEESEECKTDVEVETKEVTSFIKWDEIGKYRVYTDSVVYPVGKPVRGFIWLPLSAFENIDAFKSAIDLFSLNLKKIRR